MPVEGGQGDGAQHAAAGAAARGVARAVGLREVNRRSSL